MASRNCTKVKRTWFRKSLEIEIRNGKRLLEQDYTETSVGQVNTCIDMLNEYTEKVKRLGDEYAGLLDESEDESMETVVNEDLDLSDKALRCILKLKAHREQLKKKRCLKGPINSNAIQGLLAELDLTDCDRQLINQARCEVSKEWNVFLENATITIALKDQDIVLISGSGTNKLIVQRDSENDIQCEWEETGIGMKLKSGGKTVGEHLLFIFKYAASFAIPIVASKAMGRL